jgi:Ca2+-binding RTX toxin-like protein
MNVGDNTVTYGYGYTFIRKGKNDTWSIPNFIYNDLAEIGITLNENERTRLQNIADALNKNNIIQAKSLINQFIEDWRYVDLTPEEGNTLYTFDIGRSKTIIKNQFTKYLGPANGVELFDYLQNTSEMVALLDMAYNAPVLIGEKLAQSLWNGDRAEAWFQIRYKSNGGKDEDVKAGLAKRRYMDSNLFGLYQNLSSPTTKETYDAFKMLQRHRADIIAYEKLYGKPIDGSQPIRGDQIAAANNYYTKVIAAAGNGNVLSIEESLNSAKTFLLADLRTHHQNDQGLLSKLTDENFKSIDIYLNPAGGTDSDRTSVMSVDALGNPRSSLMIGMDQTDFLVGGGGEDVLLGESGKDWLIGGNGNDQLYGGEGNDTYYYKSGDGNDRIIDSGENTIIIEKTDGSTRTITELYNTGVNVWTTPDGEVELTHNSPWQLEIEGGGTIVLGDTFQDGDFGIHLRDAPTNPDLDNTIYGDRQSVYTPPQFDSFGNEITNYSIVQPGKNDLLYDSAADDRIEGGGGNDDIWAENGGNDHLLGGDGQDQVAGKAGDDLIEGGSDSDIVAGGLGNDQVFGETAGEMSALIAAGEIAPNVDQRGDLVIGREGDDFLYGSNAKDVVFGGAGHELIVGGGGNDIIFGDIDCTLATREWAVEIGADHAINFSNMNILDTGDAGNDVVYAGAGEDVVLGGAGDDEIDGGEGADSVSGDAGGDSIYGGGGNDLLAGDNSALSVDLHGGDYIDGGSGNDQIWGEGGSDTLFGGEDNDTIYGDDQGMVAYAGDDRDVAGHQESMGNRRQRHCL